MEPYFTVGVSVRDGLVLAEIVGEVDMVAAPQIRERVNAYLADSRLMTLMVDLAGVTFMDSAGVNLLLDFRGAALDSGRIFRVGGARGAPATVLEMTGVADLLARDALHDTTPTQADADGGPNGSMQGGG